MPRDPFTAADPDEENDTGSLSVDDDAWVEAKLPRRPWVAPGYALRGAVTVIAGPPSALKSSLMLAWACAVAFGQPHGEFAPVEAGRVLVYNVEDGPDEQRRRLSAVLRQFNAKPESVRGRVIRVSPPGVGTLFERNDKGEILPTAAMAQLRNLIAERRPAMLIADPFAELHNAEENDNTAIRAILAVFRALAAEFNIAVILIHHTRKGEPAPGDPDTARGASATIGAARVVKTLIGMSEQDAEALGIEKTRKARSAYVRLDDAKQNYAGIGDAVWYEKVLYRLDNDEWIPAAEPWNPPDLWQGVPSAVANTILDCITAGIESDKGKRHYSDAPATKPPRRADAVVRKHVPSLNERQARAVIKTWVNNEVLYRENYFDPVERKDRGGLFVNDARRPGARER